MPNTSNNDVFAQWRSKQPRKLFRVFYRGDSYDVLAHTEDEVHEQMRRVLPNYQPQLSKIKNQDV